MLFSKDRGDQIKDEQFPLDGKSACALPSPKDQEWEAGKGKGRAVITL